MKAPVPPAHEPFMRMSATVVAPDFSSRSKNTIFASWPPSSIAQRTFSWSRRTASEFATTSCTKGTPRTSAMVVPPDPHATRRNEHSGNSFATVRRREATVST